jgi:serine/tyrosine/threonine adenylyltransferase
MTLMSDSMSESCGWNLQCSYSALPAHFYAWAKPTAVAKPSLVIFNHQVAGLLGLDPERILAGNASAIFSGNELPPGSQPLAQAYAGHQFGGFTMLGDGRAILLGEQVTHDNRRFDVQLKGSGPTPYSRRGDGRAALGPMLRELIISHAMSCLGIPTTLSLAVVLTGESVFRNGPEPGAVLTRIAASHIRVGTFQYAAARNDIDQLRSLADYTIVRHYPELGQTSDRYLQFLKAVVARQADLVAQWMLVGFVHGVMNTDNVSLAGETIDYGPCAFMNSYRASTVFSSIDEHGRYAYGNQPSITQWNLARFAETLLPLLHTDIQQAVEIATQVIQEFPQLYQEQWLTRIGLKLGFDSNFSSAAELEVAENLLKIMERLEIDFTKGFRDLATGPCESGVYAAAEFQQWLKQWRARLAARSIDIAAAQAQMRSSNPCIIARNHQVEAAIEAATVDGDIEPTRKLLEVLSNPYEETDLNQEYRQPPAGGDAGYCTYCGT